MHVLMCILRKINNLYNWIENTSKAVWIIFVNIHMYVLNYDAIFLIRINTYYVKYKFFSHKII